MIRRIPYIEVSQQTECGLGCVCMLLRYYHKYVTLTELREHIDIGRDGSSLRQLVELMKEYNLDVKVYKNSVDDLKLVKTPVLLYWEESHYIILERVKRGCFYIADPGMGYRRLNYDELKNGYSNVMAVAKPAPGFVKDKISYKESMDFFKAIFFSQKMQYVKITMLSLLMYASTLVVPILIQYIIDSAQNDASIRWEQKCLFMILGSISLLYLVVFFFRGKNILKLRVNIDQRLNEKLYKHLLLLPFKYFELRGKGSIIYNLNSTATVRELLTNQLIMGIIDCGAVVFIGIYMLKLSPFLCSIAFFLFMINIIILKISYPYILQNNKASIMEQSIMQSAQMESVYSILGIKMTSIESSMYENWKKKFEKYLNTYVKKEGYNLRINTLLNFLLYASPIVILCVGISLVECGEMTIGETIAFYTLSGSFYSLAHSVFDTWTSFVNGKAIFERVSDIYLEKTEELNLKGISKKMEGEIELEHVSFRYTENSNYVLDDINIKIPKNKKISIVGKSGDGKSTLAKLLVGLYEPTLGNIYFDGVNIKDWNRKALRKQIGIVPQDITLFNKTIYENIVVDKNSEFTMEDVRKACLDAGILEEIDSMPMGFNTIISEMGMNLSGGQRQRIMLARILLNKPKILILDEATSALDNINQFEISKRIMRLQCTEIIIAHRLSTIYDSDNIFVIDKGRIVESGTHEELLSNRGIYFELYNNMEKEDVQ